MSANKIFILMDTRVGGTDDQHADTANTRWEQQGLALSKTVSTQSAELWLSAMGQSMKNPQQKQGHSRDWDKGREACKCLGKVPTHKGKSACAGQGGRPSEPTTGAGSSMIAEGEGLKDYLRFWKRLGILFKCNEKLLQEAELKFMTRFRFLKGGAGCYAENRSYS